MLYQLLLTPEDISGYSTLTLTILWDRVLSFTAPWSDSQWCLSPLFRGTRTALQPHPPSADRAGGQCQLILLGAVRAFSLRAPVSRITRLELSSSCTGNWLSRESENQLNRARDPRPAPSSASAPYCHTGGQRHRARFPVSLTTRIRPQHVAATMMQIRPARRTAPWADRLHL